MASPQKNTNTLPGLARKLVGEGLLNEMKAEQAFEQSLSTQTPFITYLVKEKIVSGRDIAIVAAEQFGFPLIDIENLELNPEIIKIEGIKQKDIEKYRAIPIFKRGNVLFIALSDPLNRTALDQFRFLTKMRTETILVEEDKLAKIIEHDIEQIFDPAGSLNDELGDIDLEVDEGEEAEEDEKGGADDAPIVKFVNSMLHRAIKEGASDLHFEPYEKYYRVRFRIDGMLREIAKPPVQLARKLAARIKVMSRLDVSERRIPQDGRIKLKVIQERNPLTFVSALVRFFMAKKW
ncbi:type IV pilus biogenesis protein PilB [Beggiatoa sp. PS]|nr:type IV pilus biogenesis protein PilB [Beggiatoa sp. PS]